MRSHLEAALRARPPTLHAMSVGCPQCGSVDPPKQGRCAHCGALVDVASVARRERITERLDRHFGDPFGWVEVVPGLVLAALIVAGLLPGWTVLIVLLFAVRPLWRLVVRIFAAWGGGP